MVVGVAAALVVTRKPYRATHIQLDDYKRTSADVDHGPIHHKKHTGKHTMHPRAHML